MTWNQQNQNRVSFFHVSKPRLEKQKLIQGLVKASKYNLKQSGKVSSFKYCVIQFKRAKEEYSFEHYLLWFHLRLNQNHHYWEGCSLFTLAGRSGGSVTALLQKVSPRQAVAVLKSCICFLIFCLIAKRLLQ